MASLATLMLAWAASSTQAGTTTASASRAPSGEDGPELRLEGLEDEVTTASTEGSAEKKEEPGFFETLADRAATIIDRTTLGGYGEHELAAGEGEALRFQNHRYVLFVYGRISDRISTATEIELEFAGSPMKKDGILGVGELLLEFSVVDFELFDWLVFRTGVILIPVGALNLRHDSPTQDLTDRPIAYTTIVPSTWFESGAGFHGKIGLGSDQRLTYELYLVNGLDARIFDGTGLRAARGSHFEDNNNDKAVVGRVAYSPTIGFELGLSGYTGEYDLAHNRTNLVNVDAMLKLGKLELLGEAVYAVNDPGFVEGFASSSPANTRDAVPEAMAGFFAQVIYHFTLPPLWDVFPDWLSESTLTGILRYEGKDTDVDRHTALGDRRRLTFGLNFRPVEQYVLKTDYQLEAHGVDDESGAPEVWQGDFWRDAEFRFATSVAYLF